MFPSGTMLRVPELNMRMLGTRVRYARERRGWTMRELARRLGISHSDVSKLEAGKKPNVGLPLVAQICAELGVRLEWLVFDRGPMEDLPTESTVRSSRGAEKK